LLCPKIRILWEFIGFATVVSVSFVNSDIGVLQAYRMMAIDFLYVKPKNHYQLLIYFPNFNHKTKSWK
jgi:hypothetical protein